MSGAVTGGTGVRALSTPGNRKIRTFRSPSQTQDRDALRHLQNAAVQERSPSGPKGPRATASPATLRRPGGAARQRRDRHDYDHCEPIEVRVNPDGIDIASYPGRDPSI